MNKITLEEFWKSKKPIAIHCNTEEKAGNLLRSFAAMGKRWNDGSSYVTYNFYRFYKQKTCYTNDGFYCYYEFYKNDGYKIYEYEEVEDILLKE